MKNASVAFSERKEDNDFRSSYLSRRVALLYAHLLMTAIAVILTDRRGTPIGTFDAFFREVN